MWFAWEGAKNVEEIEGAGKRAGWRRMRSRTAENKEDGWTNSDLQKTAEAEISRNQESYKVE